MVRSRCSPSVAPGNASWPCTPPAAGHWLLSITCGHGRASLRAFPTGIWSSFGIIIVVNDNNNNHCHRLDHQTRQYHQDHQHHQDQIISSISSISSTSSTSSSSSSLINTIIVANQLKHAKPNCHTHTRIQQFLGWFPQFQTIIRIRLAGEVV